MDLLAAFYYQPISPHHIMVGSSKVRDKLDSISKSDPEVKQFCYVDITDRVGDQYDIYSYLCFIEYHDWAIDRIKNIDEPTTRPRRPGVTFNHLVGYGASVIIELFDGRPIYQKHRWKYISADAYPAFHLQVFQDDMAAWLGYKTHD